MFLICNGSFSFFGCSFLLEHSSHQLPPPKPLRTVIRGFFPSSPPWDPLWFLGGLDGYFICLFLYFIRGSGVTGGPWSHIRLKPETREKPNDEMCALELRFLPPSRRKATPQPHEASSPDSLSVSLQRSLRADHAVSSPWCDQKPVGQGEETAWDVFRLEASH